MPRFLAVCVALLCLACEPAVRAGGSRRPANERPVALRATVQAEAVGVSDGDTFTALLEGQQVKVRIYGIDAPEKVRLSAMLPKKPSPV